MINLYVVEDQALVLGALSALLELDGSLRVAAQCTDGKQAFRALQEAEKTGNLPDMVLTDIEMPEMTGLELSAEIQSRWPQVKVVIMTTFAKAGYIRRALDSGVKGFILKEAPSESLVAAIKSVMDGKRVIDSELALLALDDQDPLSDKERQALRLASEGLKTSEVAERLFLSQGTVRNYLSEAIAKLNAANRVDAARIARQKGWL